MSTVDRIDTSTASSYAAEAGGDEPIEKLLERLRREPSLRTWVLNAPTGALASLGITLDDAEISYLLEQVDAMDERPVPILARDIMSTHTFTVSPEQSVHDAAALLSANRISGAPVCDAGGNLVGVLSEFDLIARTGTTVGEVMTHDVVSVPGDATIDTVRGLLVSRRLKRVPVVGPDGRMIGLISRADLVRELAYRWECRRCGNIIRARRPLEGCPRCGAANSFQAATPPPALTACPTCGQALPN